MEEQSSEDLGLGVTTQEMEVMLLEARQGGDLGDIPSSSDIAEDKKVREIRKQHGIGHIPGHSQGTASYRRC